MGRENTRGRHPWSAPTMKLALWPVLGIRLLAERAHVYAHAVHDELGASFGGKVGPLDTLAEDRPRQVAQLIPPHAHRLAPWRLRSPRV